MYTRIDSRAAIWVDGPNDHARPSRPPRVTRWATRPLRTPDGTARALRFDGDRASVLLVKGNVRRWAPLASALTESQAERWIRTGFRPGG